MKTNEAPRIVYNEIEKVIIVNRKKVNKKFDYKFRDIFTNPDAMEAFTNPEPDGIMYTFKITYKDHSKLSVWAKSGTPDCDKLLDLVSSTSNHSSINNNFSISDDFPTKNHSSMKNSSSTMEKS